MATHAPEAVTGSPEPGRGLFARLRRLAVSDQDFNARELQEQSEEAGGTPVTRCSRGSQVCVAGTIRSVRLAPLAGAPTFEVEIYDGSGTVRLVFLGRREVRGIHAGGSLVAHGRLTKMAGQPTIFNPRYELSPVTG